MLEIPAHGGPETPLQVVARLPTQLAADAAWVDGIATVVAGAVRDPVDQSAVGSVPECC